jgi:hypothetical protein
MVIDHDLGLGDALVHAVLAGDLDGGLVGFQAGVAEEHIGHARALGQQLGQGFLAGHMVVVAGVDQLGHLLLQRRHQLGVVVPRVLTAMPPSASRYSLPFTSQTRQPWPRSSAMGTRP